MSQRKIKTMVTRECEWTITKCDLCGLETAPGCDWPCRYGEQNETEIECKMGSYFGESDYRKFYRLDICPKCFVEKFIPAVEQTLNVKFTKGDVD